jgi:hypothetical protein
MPLPVTRTAAKDPLFSGFPGSYGKDLWLEDVPADEKGVSFSLSADTGFPRLLP